MLQVVGLEPKVAMWQYAEDNAREAGFTLIASGEGGDTGNLEARGQRRTASDDKGGNTDNHAARGERRRLRIVRGTAEAMPFSDGEFDAVVCTLVRGGGGGYAPCRRAGGGCWLSALSLIHPSVL